MKSTKNYQNPIDTYIEQQPIEIQAKLHQLRDTIRQELPLAIEKISYGIPTYWHNKNIIHFAGYKTHLALYPGPQAITVFAQQLKPYRTSKGTIQFDLDKELPLELITEITRWCRDHYQ